MSKKFLLSIISLLIFYCADAQETAYVPGELIIMLQPDVKPEVVSQYFGHVRSGETGIKHSAELSQLSNIHLYSFDESAIHPEVLLRSIRGNKNVRAAQFNHYVEQRNTAPNDPQFNQQWFHNNIQSQQAWDITTGGTTANGDEIVVAVIETANYLHNDLLANHWVNTAEVPNNGVDDDGNGYVDDYDGWNPGNNSDNVCCGGHGTSVNGMVGGRGNNGIGGSGVNWDVKIMNVNVGSLTESNVIASYSYPHTMRNLYNNSNGAQGAFVVATNASWGIDNANPSNYPVWCNYYDDLGEVGILNCGATANNNVNIDVVGDMPTGCGSDYMVSVTATNSSDQRTFSGFGATTIDLAAPGSSVFLPSGSSSYSNTSGTSFASPCVAGGIALVYSAPCGSLAGLALSNPQAAADAVRGYIFDGVDQTSQLLTQTVTGGRLNVFNSLNLALDNCGPPPSCAPLSVGLSASCGWNENTGSVQAVVTVSATFESEGCEATGLCYRIGNGFLTCVDLSGNGQVLNGSTSVSVAGLTSSTTYTFLVTTADGTVSQQITTPACNNLVAGCTDPNASNYNPNATIDNGACTYPCTDVTLTITTDCWGEEVSWEILDENDAIVDNVTTGTYGDQQTFTWSACLDNGCYTFNIFDAFGDGMNGSQWPQCTVNGNYFITNDTDGENLVTMTAPNANYGSGTTHTFCVEGADPGPVEAPCETPYPVVNDLQTSVQGNGVQLAWTPILGSLGCEVQGGLANSAGLQTIQVLQPDLSSFFIPASQLPVNDIYRVRVRCGCSLNPLIVGAWSEWEFFFWGNAGARASSGIGADSFASDNQKFLLHIYPNPSQGQTMLNIESPVDGSVDLHVYDLYGKLVHSARVQALSGSNAFQLDLTEHSAGLYLLTARLGNEIFQSKLVIQ
jgi:hypothetical protein